MRRIIKDFRYRVHVMFWYSWYESVAVYVLLMGLWWLGSLLYDPNLLDYITYKYIKETFGREVLLCWLVFLCIFTFLVVFAYVRDKLLVGMCYLSNALTWYLIGVSIAMKTVTVTSLGSYFALTLGCLWALFRVSNGSETPCGDCRGDNGKHNIRRT